VSDDFPRDVDAAYYRERIRSTQEAVGTSQGFVGVAVSIVDLEVLLEAYERMIGDKCRSCGADTRERYCTCEDDS
jgi:hypothetical protein